ncbi:unnamed protein product [Ectocarpus sp. 12 AP-2014]
MFFVYAAGAFVSLYFCAKSVHYCLPAPARRVVSRVVSEVVIVLALTAARSCRYLVALRSTYIWEKRGLLGSSSFFVRVLDTLLNVDADQARLDTSTGHASIEILHAVGTVNGRDYDITKILADRWAVGDGMRIDVPVDATLLCVGCENDSGQDLDVTTRVRYRGHGNRAKRYPSETFSARYVCKDSHTFRFPPYASSESVRRGLGVQRILRCNFSAENGKLLYGPEARESSGLRRNFYEDVQDDPHLGKNVVTFFEPSARSGEGTQLVVTTSKANSKIFCNLDLQVPPKLA